MKERRDSATDAFGRQARSRMATPSDPARTAEVARRLRRYAGAALALLLFIGLLAIYVVATLHGEELPG